MISKPKAFQDFSMRALTLLCSFFAFVYSVETYQVASHVRATIESTPQSLGTLELGKGMWYQDHEGLYVSCEVPMNTIVGRGAHGGEGQRINIPSGAAIINTKTLTGGGSGN